MAPERGHAEARPRGERTEFAIDPDDRWSLDTDTTTSHRLLLRPPDQ
jgi:hypothetical protein